MSVYGMTMLFYCGMIFLKQGYTDSKVVGQVDGQSQRGGALRLGGDGLRVWAFTHRPSQTPSMAWWKAVGTLFVSGNITTLARCVSFWTTLSLSLEPFTCSLRSSKVSLVRARDLSYEYKSGTA